MVRKPLAKSKPDWVNILAEGYSVNKNNTSRLLRIASVNRCLQSVWNQLSDAGPSKLLPAVTLYAETAKESMGSYTPYAQKPQLPVWHLRALTKVKQLSFEFTSIVGYRNRGFKVLQNMP